MYLPQVWHITKIGSARCRVYFMEFCHITESDWRANVPCHKWLERVNERFAPGPAPSPLRWALLKVLEHKRKQIICFPSAPIHTLQEMQPKCSFHSRLGSLVNDERASRKEALCGDHDFCGWNARSRVAFSIIFSLSLVCTQRSAAPPIYHRRAAHQQQHHRQTDEFERCTFLAFY